MFFSKSLDKVNKKGEFFMILSLTNGLKPLKNTISQKQNLAKLSNLYRIIQFYNYVVKLY